MKKRNYITLSAAAAVILLAAGCGGGGGEATPSAATGVYTIQVKGGDSNESRGGGADYYGVNIRSESAIEVKKGGKVDASFSMPASPYVAHLGDTPLDIATDVNISSFDNILQVADANLSAGTPYLLDGIPEIYIADADDNVSNDKTATSVTIESGTTVRVAPNFDFDNADNDNNDSTGADTVVFILKNDMVINGTLKTEPVETPAYTSVDAAGNGNDMSGLEVLLEGAFIMGKGSLIDTSGEDAVEVGGTMPTAVGNTTARGGNGGGVGINGWYYYDGYAKAAENGDNAQQSIGYYYGTVNLVRIEGTIDVSGGNGIGGGAGGHAGFSRYGGYWYNRGLHIGAGKFMMTSDGKVIAKGGNGGQGGTGAEVRIYASNDLYNAGNIDSSGGDGSVATGANAGYIALYTWGGSLYNSGDLVAVGGDGNLSAGDGGNIDLYSDWGALYNSGDLESSGGDSATAAGGDGRYITIYSSTGELRTSGNITANGGSGKTYGGHGGYITIDKRVRDEVHADTNLEVSGNISANGGAGATQGGGYSGEVNIRHYLDASVYGKWAIGGIVKLLGYNSIDVSGGDGATTGGDGGSVTMDISSHENGSFASPLHLVNEADINAKAGKGEDNTELYRARGGYVNLNMGNFNSRYESGLGTSQSYLNNSGKMDISGHGNTAYGDNAGWVEFESVGNLTNSGSVTGVGGDANGSDSYAGEGGDVEMYATNNAVNSGDMTLYGGSGEGNNSRGGDGGWLTIYALEQASNSGDIIANGGNSNGNVDNSDGGGAGIWSAHGDSTNSAANMNVAAGTGGTGEKGADGMINIDGVDVTP